MATSLIILFNFFLLVYSYKIPLPRLKRNAELGANKNKQPHIVIITASELGWDDISQHGSPLALTPNLHTLAKHGIHFSHHYITPWDFTTRVELLSGEYASHQGLQHGNVSNDQPIGLNANTKILPEYLKELGYNTTLLGKWGLGFYKKQLAPTNKGFDYFKGSLGFDSIDYYNYTSKSKYEGYDLYENDQPFYPNTEQHLTELLTEEATNIIHNQINSTKPLFLHVSFQSPQFATTTNKPQVPDHWMKPFEGIFNDTDRIGHSAMVLSLDVAIGKIMDALSVANIFDDTFFLFLTTSTSKSCSSVHAVGCNYPLKGGKGTYWEGGVRSMAMVYFGDIVAPGITIKDTVHVTDWLPTILNLASKGQSSNLQNSFHGFDLTGVIAKGERTKREFILHGYDPLANNSGSIRLRDYKLVINQQIDERSDWTKYFSYDRNKSRNLEIPGFRPVSNEKPDVDSVVLCDSGFPHPYLRLRAPPCNPSEKPCLFNILWDPCEYHNLADFLPKTAHYLYENTKMILDSGYIKKPLFPQSDSESDPKHFNNTWTPWIQINNVSSTGSGNMKQEDLSNLLEEDKIIILNNKFGKNNSQSISSESKLANVTEGKARSSAEVVPEKDPFPYQLIDENGLDNFEKDSGPEYLEKFGGNKILKISCEELDYYNYTIECISVTNSAADKNSSSNTNLLSGMNDRNNADLVKLGNYMENITEKLLADDQFKLYRNGNHSFNSNSSNSSENDPFKESFNKLFNNSNKNADVSGGITGTPTNIIRLQNISQMVPKNESHSIPVNVERFSLDEKPERFMDKNETVDVTNTYVMSSSTTSTPTLPNVTHTVGQESGNKNETTSNDEMKKKLESSFKIAKAEGTTKLDGPFDERNSTLKLLTNAIAGNITDKKKETYPSELNVDQNNPNIDWHLTSKAVSLDFSPNITRSNWTTMNNKDWSNKTASSWSNFSAMDDLSSSRSNFSELAPYTRNLANQSAPEVTSDVKAIADANGGESVNVSTLSLNESKKPNATTINNTVKKPSYTPITVPIHNVTNNTSQKSLVQDGDSLRSLEVINEPLDQNSTLLKKKCDCDSNEKEACDSKCADETQPKATKAAVSNLDNLKSGDNHNFDSPSAILGQKNEAIPFTGQIEMSNKKFNVEGTVLEELLQGKTINNGDYSVSASNDNMIGMSLLKNGGYDPKKQNHNQELEFKESSANLKLTPTANDHFHADKRPNKTRMLRSKKGHIELVGELGDFNDEENGTASLNKGSAGSANQSSIGKIISNLEKLLGNSVPTENNTLDNIRDLFKARMMDMFADHHSNNLTSSNNATSSPQNIANTPTNQTLTNVQGATPNVLSENPAKIQQPADANDAKKDLITSRDTGSRTNQVATLIAIILAGLIVIGMGIVAVVAVVAKSIDERSKSSRKKASKDKSPTTTSSSKIHRLKEKIPFNT